MREVGAGVARNGDCGGGVRAFGDQIFGDFDAQERTVVIHDIDEDDVCFGDALVGTGGQGIGANEGAAEAIDLSVIDRADGKTDGRLAGGDHDGGRDINVWSVGVFEFDGDGAWAGGAAGDGGDGRVGTGVFVDVGGTECERECAEIVVVDEERGGGGIESRGFGFDHVAAGRVDASVIRSGELEIGERLARRQGDSCGKKDLAIAASGELNRDRCGDGAVMRDADIDSFAFGERVVCELKCECWEIGILHDNFGGAAGVIGGGSGNRYFAVDIRNVVLLDG